MALSGIRRGRPHAPALGRNARHKRAVCISHGRGRYTRNRKQAMSAVGAAGRAFRSSRPSS
eukprot:3171709-Pyramimonas_sp.AAC.1